jgi:hypothetical protein
VNVLPGISKTLLGAAGIVAVAAVLACAPSPITATRIEQAMATTFRNLVIVQVSRLGLPHMAAEDFIVKANCRRVPAERIDGAGDWVCAVDWRAAGRQAQRDIYDLFVATDGCYTASIEGDNFGGPTLVRPEKDPIRNLLYMFEGCFDTT